MPGNKSQRCRPLIIPFPICVIIEPILSVHIALYSHCNCAGHRQCSSAESPSSSVEPWRESRSRARSCTRRDSPAPSSSPRIESAQTLAQNILSILPVRERSVCKQHWSWTTPGELLRPACFVFCLYGGFPLPFRIRLLPAQRNIWTST